MTDSQGRQGGSTDFYTVSASDDTTCINADSPGSTAQSTAAATSTASSTPTSNPSSSTNNGTVIGGSIAGGAVLLVTIASLVWFLFRKRKRSRDAEDESSIQGMNHKRRGRSVDLIPDDQSGLSGRGAQYPLPSPHTGDPLQAHGRDAQGRSVYDPDPYVLPPPSEAEGYFPRADDSWDGHEGMGAPGSVRHARGASIATTSAGGMSKAQMAASGSVRSHGQRRSVSKLRRIDRKFLILSFA
jgi:hypothetical protein